MPDADRQSQEGARCDGPGDQLEITATDAGSVTDFQGWVKTNKRAVLKEQRQEKDETGRDLYIHLIERADG